MQDTLKEIIDKQRAIILSKSIDERFKMTIEMYEVSKTFVKSSILNQNPDISDIDLKIEIFKRFYKKDFSEENLNRILEHLKKKSY